MKFRATGPLVFHSAITTLMVTEWRVVCGFAMVVDLNGVHGNRGSGFVFHVCFQAEVLILGCLVLMSGF